MYIVDPDNNKLIPAQSTSFKDQNIKERQHLQEWIAKNPEVLGEKLLIIQKEFDGFSDTRERLDLLALDGQGNIVVIENKLDDSGRDVTWQAIKYASYCSSLSKEEIIEIYAKYLGESKDVATERICAFYDIDDLDEMDLNLENTQRIFFVAANFGREITSSVLWLRNYGIDARCYKVSPFVYNGKLLVDFDQIIPMKDAEDYVIKMAEKKKAETTQAAATRQRHNERSEFWQKFIDYNQQVNGDYASSAGTPDSWLGKGGIGIPGVSVNIVISKTFSRTEIYVNTGDKDLNKRIYDHYFNQKDKLESQLGTLEWQRLDDRVTCRIAQAKPLTYCNDDDHQAIFEFFTERTSAFIKAFNQASKGFKK